MMETRPVGKLESWSVYRCNQDIYRNVLVALKYVPKKPIDVETFEQLVTVALRDRVLLEQPILSCVVDAGTSEKPVFRMVDRRDMPISVITHCQDIENFFRNEHEHGPSNDKLWRVTLVAEGSAYWVSFAFHHGVGDGTSGLIFHEHLLKALQELQDRGRLEPVARDSLPPSIEESGLVFPRPWKALAQELALKLPLPTTLRNYLSEPQFYSGHKTTLEQRRQRKTYLRTFKLSPEKVKRLRQIAKHNKISIHALLHAAAVHSITTDLPIKTSTPINLRPLLPNPQERLIANYACAHSSTTPREKDPLTTAKVYYSELNQPAARQEAISALGMLDYINNHKPIDGGLCGLEQLIHDRLATTDDHCLRYTLETSNLGNWIPPVLPDWTIEDIHFTGCNSGIGELFCVGVATVAGRIMNISCTTSDTYVDKAEVDTFMDTFESNLELFPHI